MIEDLTWHPFEMIMCTQCYGFIMELSASKVRITMYHGKRKTLGKSIIGSAANGSRR